MPTGARLRPPRPLLTGVLALAVPALLTACTADQRPAEPPGTAAAEPAPDGVDGPRDDLAALAAAAQDRHLTARYLLTGADGGPAGAGGGTRSIVVTSANDGTWRVDVPGGALGGAVDISLAATADGLFQCTLPTAGRAEPAGCVRLGDPDDLVPRRWDPRVQHPFTDWLDVLTDRRAPLAVSVGKPPTGMTGTCFSVESTSASLNPPLDVGVYCYAEDGTPTGVRAALGTLRLAGEPGPAPATVQLAGPVVEGEPLDVAAPPAPSDEGGTPTS